MQKPSMPKQSSVFSFQSSAKQPNKSDDRRLTTDSSFLKIGAAAKILGVSIDTLRRWEKKGKITAIRTPGGTRLFSVENFHTKSLSTEELLRRTNEQGSTASVIVSSSVILSEAKDIYSSSSATASTQNDNEEAQDDNIKKSFVAKFLIGTAILSVITLLLTSWITASYLTSPKETQQFFKNNIASGLFLPFHTLAGEIIAVIDPGKAQELGFSPPGESFTRSDLATRSDLKKISSNVLAVTASPRFLEVNSDTQINGSLFVRDSINGLSLEATPSAGTIALNAGTTTLTITKTAKLDQDVSTAASPAFNTLNLSGTKNQLIFQSGGPTGTLTWTPTTARIITLPDVTTTLVGIDNTQTLTNKSMSGSSNTFTNIPNSGLSNSKITVTAGTNLTGGGDINLGSSGTISLKDDISLTSIIASGNVGIGGSVGIGTTAAPSFPLEVNGSIGPTTDATYDLGSATKQWKDLYISGTITPGGQLLLADGTAAAPGLSFKNDTDSGLWRIANNTIALTTGGSATKGLTINSSGNVGIGTTSPSYGLDVNKAVGTSVYLARFIASDGRDTNIAIDSTQASDLDFNSSGVTKFSIYENGTNTFFQTYPSGSPVNRMTFLLGGNIGIGTTNPGNTLSVVGNVGIGTSANVNAGLSVMTGNVGIGTTAPSAKLDVTGSIVTNAGTIPSFMGSGSIVAYVPNANSSVGTGFLAQILDGPNTEFGGYAISKGTATPKWFMAMSENLAVDPTALGFYEDSSLTKGRLIIATGGNVGIGTTQPSFLLDVNGTARLGATTVTGAISASTGSLDIGSVGTRFGTGYFDTVNATNIAGTIIGGSTTSQTWTINSGNTTDDTQDSSLAFERGNLTPNALMTWNSTAKQFDFNSGATFLGTIGSGNVGIGTTNPGNLLTVFGGNVGIGTTAFVNAGLSVMSGNVGIGTTSPTGLLALNIPNTGTANPFWVYNNSSTELITNQADRDFSSTPNWSGTNWAVASAAFQHTSGSTTDAVLTNSNLTAGSIINGRRYKLTFTISGMTAGNVTPKIGTASNAAYAANGTYNVVIKAAANDANLIFTPTTLFNGSIDDISLTRTEDDVVIASNGNVGIGTTNPIALLNLAASDNNSTILSLDVTTQVASGQRVDFRRARGTAAAPTTTISGDSLGQIAFQNYNGSYGGAGNIQMLSSANGRGGDFFFATSPSGSSGSSTVLALLNNGNVGIGRDNIFPNAKLEVSGSGLFADTSNLGTDKVTNGNFSTVPDLSWTWGTGWSHDTTNLRAAHTSGNTADLEQNVSAVAGETYYISFTLAGKSSGTVTPSIGGTTGDPVYKSATIVLIAQNTGNLKITPSTDFDGYVDTIVVKKILGGNLAAIGVFTGGGSNGLKVDYNGNVGIGTTNPGNILSVIGNIGIGTTANVNAGLSVMTGNVGIGTTAPTARFEIMQSADTNLSGIRIANSANTFSGRLWEDASNNFRIDNGVSSTGNISLNGTGTGNVGIGTTNPGNILSVIGNVGIGTTANVNAGLSVMTGNVGIGTTLPLRKTEIESTSRQTLRLTRTAVAGGGAGVEFKDGNAILYEVYGWSAGGTVPMMAFDVNASTKMVINNSGNIGIGTTNPGNTLSVMGNVGIGTTANVNTGATPGLVSMGNVGIGTTVPLSKLSFGTQSGDLIRLYDSSAGASYGLGMATGELQAYVPTAGHFSFNSGGDLQTSGTNELMRITAGGNVGIGTTNPGNRLTVFGGNVGIGTTASVNAALSVMGGNVGIGTTTTVAKLSVWGTGTAGAINFLARDSSGADKFAILDNGNVGIGTTTPGNKLNVMGGNVGIGTTSAGALLDIASTSTTGPDLRITNTGIVTGTVAQFTADALTTGKLFDLSADGLTTGTVFNLQSTSTVLSSGSLMALDWSPTGSTTIYSTGDLFSVNAGQYASVGNLLNLKDNGSSVFSVSQTAVTTSLPTSFTAAGDVSIAYDINLTNPTASYIKSAAPLYITSGETFNSSDLNLTTYNQGSTIINQDNQPTAAGTSYALQILPSLTSSTNSLTYTAQYGTYQVPTVNLTGTSGTVTSLYNNYQGLTATAGTVTNWYGYYVAAPTGSGTVTGKYALVTEATAGNVGIGTTAPIAKFGLWGDGTGTGLTMLVRDSAGTNRFAIKDNGNVGIGTTTPGGAMSIMNGNVGIGLTQPAHNIDVVGDAGLSTGTAWTSTSDIRFKNIEGNLTGSSLDKIMALHPIAFDWNELHTSKFGADPGTNFGFIAQEVQQVIPEFISQDQEGYLWYNPSGMEAILTAGIQELNAKIATSSSILANVSIDSGGSLDIPKIKTDKITLTSNVGNIDISFDGQNIVYSPDQTTNYQLLTTSSSAFVDLSGKVIAVESSVKSLESSVATASAQLATLSEQLASLSARIATSSASSVIPRSEATSESLLVKIATDSSSPRNDVSQLNLTPPDILLATGSANLANLSVSSEATVSGKLTAYDLNIQNSLKSLGETSLGNTIVAGDLTIDGTMTITGSAINNVGILYLQNSPLADKIDLFNGKVIIDKSGNLVTQTITASDYKAVLGSSVGSGTIPTGQLAVEISSGVAKSNSRILLTPTISTSTTLSITAKSAGKFTVSISQPATADLTFDWFIVNEAN